MSDKRRSVQERHWNPYTWRVRELARLRHQPHHDARRGRLVDELIVAEVNEVARGVRHVSIVHGPVGALDATLCRFLDVRIDELVADAPWSRRRGGGDHVILAVSGADAEDRVAQVAAEAVTLSGSTWRVALSARPVLG